MANEELHLEHAPIVEAVIAIDVGTPLSDEQMRDVEKAASTFQSEYPISEPLGLFHVQLNMGGGRPPEQTTQSDATFGRKYVSGDKTQLVVFRRSGFSFSRLPPYQRWTSFRNEAKRFWDIYRLAAGPMPIVRFGLRYINRISVPIGENVNKYLRLFPEVPDNRDGTPRIINASFMRVDSMLKEIDNGRLIIQQAALPPQDPDTATLSLDFDITVQVPQSVSEEYVWDTLEIARNLKNEIFVDSLTPEFLETFR